MFSKYKKEEKGTKVLLLYLLLNGFLEDKDVEPKIKVETIEEERLFGLKLKKVYGIINFQVDMKQIEAEINAIPTPIVCSLSSYEYYADSKTIYVYTPEEDDQGKKGFYITDLGIVSKTMVISDNIVISDCLAKKIADPGCTAGFEFFKEYVLKNEVVLGDWFIKYENQVFSIFYQKELLYSAIEIDKTSTYKLVIYTIKKICQNQQDYPSDMFVVSKYANTDSGD